MKTNTKKKESQPANNSFLTAFAELRNGQALSEASDGLAKIVQEVRRVGKSGEPVIKLKVTPDDGESMSIRCDVNAKAPKKETRATSFYDSEDGTIQRDNPRQAEMFATVEGGQSEEQAAPPQAMAVNA